MCCTFIRFQTVDWQKKHVKNLRKLNAPMQTFYHLYFRIINELLYKTIKTIEHFFARYTEKIFLRKCKFYFGFWVYVGKGVGVFFVIEFLYSFLDWMTRGVEVGIFCSGRSAHSQRFSLFYKKTQKQKNTPSPCQRMILRSSKNFETLKNSGGVRVVQVGKHFWLPFFFIDCEFSEESS